MLLSVKGTESFSLIISNFIIFIFPRMFQLAAGLFSAVSAPVPESSTEQKPTPDLSTECAQALSGE